MKYTFLILSNQPFDFELKTNKWHIATNLSKLGHNVVFVDPPLRFRALKEYIKRGFKGGFFRHSEKKRDNLIVYKPANLFNFWPFSKINTSMHFNEIDVLLKSFKNSVSVNDKVIVWVYHFDFPDLKNFLEKMNYDLLIYDVVDEYTAFPEYSQRKRVNPSVVSWIQWVDDELKIRINQGGKEGVEWVLAQEEWLAEKADLLFASAPGLVKKFLKWREDVHYLPNAADVKKFDHDRNSLSEPDDIKELSHPRIGFSGAIDTYKNNIKLIEKSAITYPDYNFIMIGPEKVSDPDLDLGKLKSMRNVHFLGLKPWEETPNYFSHFDAYFIPYNLNEYTVGGCFPVKYFEALAAGLPTVVTNMPAYEGFDPDGYVSKTDDDFIENLKRAIIEDSKSRIEARKALARMNSWAGKVEKQLKLIKKSLNE